MAKLSQIAKYLPPTILAALAFVLYYSTLARSIYLEDSAEFVTAASTLSIPHPSGYPLYILTAKIISLFPFLPTIVERINFVSLFWTLAAIVLLYFCVSKLYSRTIAWALSFIFAVSPLVWQQATYAEVYSLNTFFFVLLFWLYLYYRDNPSHKRLYLLIFTYGLSLTNHYLPLAIGPLLAAWLLSLRAKPAGVAKQSYSRDKESPSDELLQRDDRIASVASTLPRNDIVFYLKLFCFFLLGLIPYLYIPIRAAMHPPFAWFRGDMTKLLTYNLAYGYKISGHTLRYIHDILKSLLESFGWVGWSLSFTGFVALFWKKHFLRWPATISFALLSIGLVTVLSSGQEYTLFASSFYKTLHVPALMASLLPLGWLLQLIYKSKFRFLLFYPLLLLLLSLPAGDLGGRWLANNRGDYNFLDSYSLRLLESLPPKAALFVHHDNVVNDPIIFSLAYQQYVKKIRLDITIYSLTPVFLPPDDFPVSELGSVRELKSKLVEKYLIGHKNNFSSLWATAPLPGGASNGFVYQISGEQKITNAAWAPENLELPAVRDDVFSRLLVAKYYYDLAARFYGQGDLKTGQWFLVRAISYDPDEFSEYYYKITALRDNYFKQNDFK